MQCPQWNVPVIRQPFTRYDHGDDVHDHHDAGEDEDDDYDDEYTQYASRTFG